MKRLIFHILTACLVLFLIGAQVIKSYANGYEHKDCTNETTFLYAWVDDLNVRAEPDPSLPSIAKVSEGEAVIFLGKKSFNTNTYTLRGKTITSPFVKVKLGDGVIGWIFEGALQEEPVVFREYTFDMILTSDEFNILFTGYNIGIDVQNGETWYGLYKWANDYELIETEIIAETGLYDELIGEYIGTSVSVQEAIEELFFLVKGDISLSPGIVQTVFSGNLKLVPENSRILRLGNEKYQLLITGCSFNNYKARLIHFNSGTSHLLYDLEIDKVEFYDDSDYVFKLIWAGDLDRDGKLDLLFDLPWSYLIIYNYSLYLSSTADNGFSLGTPARYIRSGD